MNVGDLRTEILLSAPNAALKTLFFRIDMTFRDVFSTKSISMYRCNLAACGPFYLPPKKNVIRKLKEERERKDENAQRGARSAYRYQMLARASESDTKPIVEKEIDRSCAEVGSYIDQGRTWLL